MHAYFSGGGGGLQHGNGYGTEYGYGTTLHFGGEGGGHFSTMAISLTILPALHNIVVLSFSPSNFPRTITLLTLSSNSIFSMQNSSVASQNYIIDEFIDAGTLVQTRIYI